MAKRNSYERNSEWVKVEEEVPVEESIPETTVQLRLLKEVNLRVVGAITGTIYIFNGAGSVSEVSPLDAPTLLEKRIGKSCCGSESSPYFEIIGGQ